MISVVWGDTQGKHVIANRDILGGEVIIKCNPYSFGISMGERKSICSTCWNYEENNYKINCIKCKEFYYCSDKCKENSKHKEDSLECKLIANLHVVTKNYIKDQFIDIQCLISMICNSLKCKNFDELQDISSKSQILLNINSNLDQIALDPSIYDILQLEGNLEKFKSQINFKTIENLVYDVKQLFHKILNEINFDFPTWFYTLIDFDNDMLIQLLCKFKCNNFGIWSNIDDQKCLGSCIYGAASYFNHSCFPNACKVSDESNKSIISIRSIFPIKKGQEITISYFNLNTPKKIRTELTNSYFFTCNCILCSGNKNQIEEIEDYIDKITCTICNSGILYPVLLNSIPLEEQISLVNIDNFCPVTELKEIKEPCFPNFENKSKITRKCNHCNKFDPLGASYYIHWHEYFSK